MRLNKYQRRIISLLVLILIVIGLVSLVRIGVKSIRASRVEEGRRTEKTETLEKTAKKENKKEKKKDSEEKFSLILKDKLIDTSECNSVITDDDIYISVGEIAGLLGGNEQWNSETGKYILNCLDSYCVIDVKNKTIVNSEEEEKNIKVVGTGNNLRVSFFGVMDSFGYKTTKLYNTDYYWTRPADYEVMPVEIAHKYKDRIEFDIRNYKSKYIRERKEFEEAFPNKKKDLEMREIPSDKMVYITVSGGPNENTERILTSLNESEVNATFFFTGKNMESRKKVTKRVYDCGNAIGLQGMTGRPEILYSSIEKFTEEMEEGEDVMKETVGVGTKLIRPAYGSYPNMTQGYRDAAIEDGFRIWDWNIDSTEAGTNPMNLYEYVMNRISSEKPNIILFSSSKEAAESIPYIVKDLRAEGYGFDIITEDLYPYNFWEDRRIESSEEQE